MKVAINSDIKDKIRETEEEVYTYTYNKQWNRYAVEYYSAIKQDEHLPFVTTWMDLESFYAW